MASIKDTRDGLTKPQQEALDAFRDAKGRNWKAALRANWERASYPGVSADHAAALQQVRNTLGPEWLTKYRAPEPEALSWEAGREAKTLDEAKELAGVALVKLGLPEPTWRPSLSSVTPWEYADVDVGGREKLVVGASSGGVVSVSGDPFTPEKRETNVTLARVIEALEPRINSLRATVTEEAKTEVVGALMKSLEGWWETSRRHENTLLGERIIVLDKHERAFSQIANNGEPAIQLGLPDPDLNGVSFMTPESAKKVCDHLAERWPDSGPYVARDFQDYAKEKYAETLKLLKSIRERVYDFPNGFRSEAENMYGWLRHEGFSPEWDTGERDGKHHMGITIPVHEVPQLRIFQKTNPARWGNHPDVAQAMKDNQREIEEQSKINREKLAKLTPEQRDWIEVIHYETHLHLPQALELNERLHELAAQHFKLAHMDVSESGLSKRQEQAREAIEQQITELLDGVPNVKGPHFVYDPRGTTVGVKFESGRADSITGSYKVPLNPERVKALGNEDFWEVYPVNSEFAEQLGVNGLGGVQASGFADRLVELATKHTKLAMMASEGGWDEDRIFDAKAALRAEVNAVVNEVNNASVGASQQPVVRGVEFTFDPRYATVILELESGRSNRMSGGWGVPVDDEGLEALDGDELLDQYAADEHGSYVVLTIEETGNAAFVDLGRDQEVARIIDEAADKIASHASVGDADFLLRDVNGNRVGRVEVTTVTPTGDVPDGTVRLAIETGNAAFEHDANLEVSLLLRGAAEKVRDGEHVFALHDTNGAMVGKFEYREEPSLAKDGVIDMDKAMNSGRVYLAEDGWSGIADGEYRFIVTAPDFEPGYGQGEGDVWLVNAKGEIADGYESPQSVRETLFRELNRDEKSDLRAVVEGRVPFEEYERRFSDDDPELA